MLGGRLAWYAETARHARTVFAHHWPEVPNLGDIRTIDWTRVRHVDVLTAGFPCQDISNAGKRAGITGPLQPLAAHQHALRHRPPLVFVENVAALRRRGLDVVHADLAALGYDTSRLCLRASDIGAAHRRDRLFLLATRGGGDDARCPRPAPVTAKDPDTTTGCPTSSNPTAPARSCCQPHAPATPAPPAAEPVPASGRRCHRGSYPSHGRRTARQAARDDGAPTETSPCRPQPCDAQRLPYRRPGLRRARPRPLRRRRPRPTHHRRPARHQQPGNAR
nr:DNA cytosine methyltransferase [Micromonospora chersina]